MVKISVWKAECAFCDKKIMGLDKEKLEAERKEHETNCEGLKSLRELYDIPLEDRLVLFKILESGEKINALKKFMKKNKKSIEDMRTMLDELEGAEGV